MCTINHLVTVMTADVQFSYKEATASLEQLHSKWKELLDISPDSSGGVAVRQLESAVGLYLRRVSSKRDVTSITKVGSFKIIMVEPINGGQWTIF